MKSRTSLLVAATLTLALPSASPRLTAQTAANDPGWPRVFKQDGKQLTIYQPQVDFWHGYTNLQFRCAIAVKGVLKQEKFGVAEVDALTVVDQAARVVAIVPLKRELRFPNLSDWETASLRQAVEQLHPLGKVSTLSLDRVLAYLDPTTQPLQQPVAINLEPPQIYYSSRPAVLVMFMGEPQFKPVETNRTDLLFALNTNWEILYDTASQLYFLLNGDTWLTAPDAVKDPWTPAGPLPASFSSLPANDNWVEVRKRIPGRPSKDAPTVFVTTQPAELIVTKGEPSYMPIRGTKILRVIGTDSVLFLNSGDAKFYFLVAGRWFRASQLSGPWSAASSDLPSDFGNIPDNDPAAFVKASVPGTREASDAVLLASVPTITVVNVTNSTVQVIYTGSPQFASIQGTTVLYAVNSPYTVFLVNGGYYCCDQGVWFCGASSSGPWRFCTSVPPAIYTIPPTSPMYNVTYVVVQSSTPTTVIYAQTSGYSGEYAAATGVLVFGAGMLVGAAIANNNRYYYPPYPVYYSYGCGATYHYGYGGYYSSAQYYGPYGGAGKTAAYNPSTGIYSRSAYAYGSYGSATAKQAYNPYSRGYAQAAQVNTAYGSAARGSAYNPTTGAARSSTYGNASASRAYNPATDTYSAHAQVNTASGSARRGYVQQGHQATWGGSRSSAYGSASAVKTTEGSSGASWNTANGQGGVAKTQSGDVYAAKDGTAYKKNSDGTWSQNSGSGWQTVKKPTSQSAASTSKPAYSTTTTPTKPGSSSTSGQTASQAQQQRTASGASGASMESQAQARSYGNQQAERTSQFRSGGGRRR